MILQIIFNYLNEIKVKNIFFKKLIKKKSDRTKEGGSFFCMKDHPNQFGLFFKIYTILMYF